METTENLVGNILDILRFRITKISPNENQKNQIENAFQEISSPFEGVNTEPLLNAFVKEKLIMRRSLSVKGWRKKELTKN